MHLFLKQNLTTYCLFILVWVYDLDMFSDRFCEIHFHQSQAGTGSKWIVHSSATYIIQLNVLDSMQGEAWLKWGRIDFPNGRFDAATCHLFYTAAVRAWWPWEPGEESAHSWCHSPAPVPLTHSHKTEGEKEGKEPLPTLRPLICLPTDNCTFLMLALTLSNVGSIVPM